MSDSTANSVPPSNHGPSNGGKEKRGVLRGKTLAWAMWDWAEQPYPTIMQTFIFPVYLAGAVAAAGTNADAQLGVATAIAGIALALIAPVLGRRSDESGRRKFWLMVNTYVLVAIMFASFFVEPKPEFFLFGLVLYGLGSLIQESAFINYYAMLKPHCSRVDIWHTTYHHPLAGGASGIVEWFKGSGLIPFLSPLTESERAQYLQRYLAEVAKAYPALADGSVLLPFPRMFIVATR